MKYNGWSNYNTWFVNISFESEVLDFVKGGCQSPKALKRSMLRFIDTHYTNPEANHSMRLHVTQNVDYKEIYDNALLCISEAC